MAFSAGLHPRSSGTSGSADSITPGAARPTLPREDAHPQYHEPSLPVSPGAVLATAPGREAWVDTHSSKRPEDGLRISDGGDSKTRPLAAPAVVRTGDRARAILHVYVPSSSSAGPSSMASRAAVRGRDATALRAFGTVNTFVSPDSPARAVTHDGGPRQYTSGPHAPLSPAGKRIQDRVSSHQPAIDRGTPGRAHIGVPPASNLQSVDNDNDDTGARLSRRAKSMSSQHTTGAPARASLAEQAAVAGAPARVSLADQAAVAGAPARASLAEQAVVASAAGWLDHCRTTSYAMQAFERRNAGPRVSGDRDAVAHHRGTAAHHWSASSTSPSERTDNLASRRSPALQPRLAPRRDGRGTSGTGPDPGAVSEPIVRVRIGQITVHAATHAAPRPAPTRPKPSVMSLADYLRSRSEARS